MIKKLCSIYVISLFTVTLFMPIAQVSAANATDWRAGRIIDDAVFTNANSMSAQDIQNFLNDRVGRNGRGTPGVCDTNGTRISEFGGGTRAEYGAANGNPAPFTCLKDYWEVPKTAPGPGIPANNYGGAPIPAGAKSAAQLIWDAAQRYQISPKVLLVTIQKESAGPLTTDDWPFRNQYTYAMGAHCPDSGPNGSANCNANYAGFSIQISESAALFRYYLDNMDKSWWPFKKLGNNSILFHPNTACGSSNINIETRATAALYTYTPYQPNQAALNNLYGIGDGCSAYGNRNFWRIFTDWFGSTQTNIAFSWAIVKQEVFSDANRTRPLTSIASAKPGDKLYLRVSARNTGFEPWLNSFMNIGTSGPQERLSAFQDSTWLTPTRPASLKEANVPSGSVGTFEFAVTMPQKTGSYNEYFNLVAEGKTWLNDIGMYFTLDSTVPVGVRNLEYRDITPGTVIKRGQRILSSDTHSILTLQNDGNLVLYSNFVTPVWNSATANSQADYAVMQSDGNFVIYTADNRALWSTATTGANNRLVLQTDGNLVIYSSQNQPLWASNSVHNPDHLNFTISQTGPAAIFPGQFLETADRKYVFVLQSDGNFVLYSSGNAIWSSATNGRSVSHLALQPDGNMVIYDTAGRSIWHTGTFGNKNAFLVVQQDGNAVIYRDVFTPIWNTNTAGR